jgi:hypothetical protein
MAKRIRLRFWEAEFCSMTFNIVQRDGIEELTSLRVRLGLGAPLELSSEALRLPEASECFMRWSRFAVIVEVMFIDESG